MYVRAGAIIPILPDGMQTLAPATDPTVSSVRADVPAMHVTVYPHPNDRSWSSDFVLHDGTALSYQASATNGSFTIVGQSARRSYVVTIPRNGPSAVTWQGAALPRVPGIGDEGTGWDTGPATNTFRAVVTPSAPGPITLTWIS